MKQILKIHPLEHARGLTLPQYMSVGAAGMDLCAAVQNMVQLAPMECKLIPTGLKMEIPLGYEIQIRPRSGLALKHQIILPNSPGTIDSDYRGEVQVIMMNLGKQVFEINRGDRIAQAVLCKYEQAQIEVSTELTETVRGEGGFGSTGTTLK